MKKIINTIIEPEIAPYINELNLIRQSLTENEHHTVFKILQELSSHAPEIFATNMIRACQLAFESQNWTHALNLFNENFGDPYNIYIGPIKSKDNDHIAMSFILLKNKKNSQDFYAKLNDLSINFTNDYFQTSCGFKGRVIEFYDLIFASENFLNSAVNKIALFSPFYFSNVDLKNVIKRRSILFHNMLKIRFEHCTKPLLQRVSVNGKEPALFRASALELDLAIFLWIAMHEMMHCSGPIPFFGAVIKKQKLGFGYAHIEEARVDMTTYILLSQLTHAFGEMQIELTKDLILFERILRSARQIYFNHYNDLDNFDCYHGLLWLDSLLKNDGLMFVSDTIYIKRIKILEAIKRILENIYQTENLALKQDSNELSYQLLLRFAEETKQKLTAGYNKNNFYRDFYAHNMNSHHHYIDFDLHFDIGK